jgi:hypothetical protein
MTKILKIDLLNKCKELGLKKYKSKKKAELIKLIENHENNLTKLENRINIDKLPYELLVIIKDYLNIKDIYYSAKIYFRIQSNYSLVCKSMYNVFMLNSKEYENTSINESKKLINRKECINIYGISENELDIIYGSKSHRNFRQKTVIYNMVNVMELSHKKYGDYDNYIKIKKLKELEQKIYQENIIKEINNRELLLISMLKKHNLQLRDDSLLCNNYIQNNIGDPEEIVKIMVEMDFYFKYTDYSDLIYEYTSNYIDYRKHYIYDDYGYFNIKLSQKEKNNLSEQAKKEALKEWCKNKLDYNNTLSNNKLPLSLYDKVKIFFKNNDKSI